MALFDVELIQHYENEEPEWKPPTFKDCVAADVDLTFFNGNEHASTHHIDDRKDVLVILEESDLRQHNAYWEGGAKQNFDTGLYQAHAILYIRVSDYGPKPKVGKLLVMDDGTDQKRTFSILQCREEDGVYRITMKRTRQ